MGNSDDKKWFMLLKFGSKENLEKLQAGQLYMKNLQYYVDLEKATADQDVGDKYDGQLLLRDVSITIDTHEFVERFSAPTASMNLGYLKCPVFCMFMVDDRNQTQEVLNGEELIVRYDFSDEQRTKMHSFGEYVLLIKDENQFVEHIKKGLLAVNIGCTRDFVQYYDKNLVQHAREVQDNNMRIAFWKRGKYRYQQEYRFLAHTEVDDYLCVEIGDIHDITQTVKASDFLNGYFQLIYNVKPLSIE